MSPLRTLGIHISASHLKKSDAESKIWLDVKVVFCLFVFLHTKQKSFQSLSPPEGKKRRAQALCLDTRMGQSDQPQSQFRKCT